MGNHIEIRFLCDEFHVVVYDFDLVHSAYRNLGRAVAVARSEQQSS